MPTSTTHNEKSWVCLANSVWPFSFDSLQDFATKTRRVLRDDAFHQQAWSSQGLFQSDTYIPNYGLQLEQLPVAWARCLYPPTGSLGDCWQPVGTFFTWSCLFCCDPRHGPSGYPDCFDEVFSFQRCCDAAPSTAVDVVVSAEESGSQDGACEKLGGQLDLGLGPVPAGWHDEVQETVQELRQELRFARRHRHVIPPTEIAKEEQHRARRERRRTSQRRLVAWLGDSKNAERSRTRLFRELDLWVSTKTCVHKGRWFLWDSDSPNASERDVDLGEVDGLEFAFANGGMCSKHGLIFGEEKVSNTNFKRVLIPREDGWSTSSSASDEHFGEVERYQMDVFWGELMQFSRPPSDSVIEWRRGTALLIKEPMWQIAHASQEYAWLWNLFWPLALPQEVGDIHLAFIRWAAYDMSMILGDEVSKDSDIGALRIGGFEMNVKNARSVANSISHLYDQVISDAAKNATGKGFPSQTRQKDRRGVIFPRDDTDDEVVGDPEGTLCFDQVMQPFRSWPGGADVYDGLRESVLRKCGIQPMHHDGKVPRRLVVIERGPSVLGSGRRERVWADRDVLRQALEAWGLCRAYEVRFVTLGALHPCQMAEEVANAGILFGVHGADIALAVLQPSGAALIEVEARTCASVEGLDLEILRQDEEQALLGGGPMPLPSKWDVGSRERIEELRSSLGGGSGACPYLSRAEIHSSARRRRYVSDGMRMGEGFLGGGGWWTELARHRNLMYLSLQRCQCMGVPENETVCMAGGKNNRLNGSHTPAIRVHIDLHVIPMLDAILEEHYDVESPT